MSPMNDPYKILGIEKGATQREIKSAYIRMSRKYHPDMGGDSWAFQMVERAYRQLSTPEAGHSSKENRKRSARQSSESNRSAANNDGSTNQGPEADDSPESNKDTFEEFEVDESTTGPNSSRRSRRSTGIGIGYHLIGAIGGGLCALCLLFAILYFQKSTNLSGELLDNPNRMVLSDSKQPTAKSNPVKEKLPTAKAPVLKRDITKLVDGKRSDISNRTISNEKKVGESHASKVPTSPGVHKRAKRIISEVGQKNESTVQEPVSTQIAFNAFDEQEAWIHEKSNIRLRREGTRIGYWCVETPGKPANLIYKFSFSKPARTCRLVTYLHVYPFLTRNADVELRVSIDKRKWHSLTKLDASTPTRDKEISKQVEEDISNILRGAKTLFVEVRLNAARPIASQFLRTSGGASVKSGTGQDRFVVEVEF